MLAIACSIALSACGSSGGGTPSAQPAPTPQQPGNNSGSGGGGDSKQTEDAKKAEEAKKAEDAKKANEANSGQGFGGEGKVMSKALDGGVLVAKKRETGDLEYAKTEAPTASDKNSVVLDGVAINTKDVKAGEFTLGERSTNGGKADAAQYAIHSGDLLPDVRYGGVADVTNLRDFKQALFVQGTPAGSDTVAAQKGEATYKGIGLHFANGLPVNTSLLNELPDTSAESKLENLYPTAKATDVTAKVNFDQKTINVSINRYSDQTVGGGSGGDRIAGVVKSNARDMAENLSFNGDLHGNTFSNKQGTMQGGFFGAKADQLAGTYSAAGKNQRDEDVVARGVFGAKRQDAAAQAGGQPDAPVAKPDAPVTQPKVDAAATELKKGETGEQYFLSNIADLTKVIINGTAIALAPVTDKLHQTELGSDYKSFVASGNLSNVVFGAAKLADNAYSLFVQGVMSTSLPSGTAKYAGDVLNFRARNLDNKENWVDAGNTYRTTGSFTADVNFDTKTIAGKINSGDRWFMNERAFTADITGSSFNGKWTSSDEQGSVTGGFYGDKAAEMAGRYSYHDKKDTSNNAFGVFGGKKQ